MILGSYLRKFWNAIRRTMKRSRGHEITNPSPLAKSFSTRHGDQVHIMISTKCLDQLDVIRLVAILCQNAKLCSMLLDCLGGFMKTTDKSVVGQWFLQHQLQGCHQIHRFSKNWSRFGYIFPVACQKIIRITRFGSQSKEIKTYMMGKTRRKSIKRNWEHTNKRGFE